MYSGVLVPQPGIRNHLLQRKAFLMLTGVLNYTQQTNAHSTSTVLSSKHHTSDPYEIRTTSQHYSFTAYHFILQTPIELMYTSQLSWATPFCSPNCMGLGPVGMISEILHLYPLPSSTNDPDEMWTSYKFIAFNERKHAPHLKHVLAPHLKHSPHLKRSPRLKHSPCLKCSPRLKHAPSSYCIHVSMHFILNMHLILNMRLTFTMNNLSIPHILRASEVSAWSVCD